MVGGFGCGFFIVAGGADPGRGAERLAERLVGGEPAANHCVRIGDLRDAGQSRTEAEPRDPSVRDDRPEAEARGGAVALGL